MNEHAEQEKTCKNRSPHMSGIAPILSVVCLIKSKLYVDRRRSPGLGGTPGGAQGRSSWEGGAPKAQYRPKAGKKKKTREAGLFFLVPASF